MSGRELVSRLTDEANGYCVLDRHGAKLVVGSRIAEYVMADDNLWPGGYVTDITDPDGDVDDYGRSICINPRVTVLFDNGEQDIFGTHLQNAGYCDPFGNDPAEFMSDELELKYQR